jgi:inosine/guanosine/xanthosine phosphorylase family protein
MQEWTRAQYAADALADALGGVVANSAIICGSGLAGLPGELGAVSRVPFADVGLPVPRVAGHGGEVWWAPTGGGTLVFAGRLHLYEGVSVDDVVAATRASAAFGCTNLIVTNAVASTRPQWPPGSVVAISDHINLTGHNPLVGDGSVGSRFVDVTSAYDSAWRLPLVRDGVVDGEGVLASGLGPSYETPAEVRMLKLLGADLVGMSVVCETIAARQLGMRVLGLSLVTNLAAGMTDELSHEDVVAVAADAAPRFAKVVTAALAAS